MISQSKHRLYPLRRSRTQSGVVLVVALIIMAIVTLLGVSAMRGTNLDTKIAVNHEFKQLSFQIAENALFTALGDDPGNVIPATTVPNTVRNHPDYVTSDVSSVDADYQRTLSADMDVTFVEIREGCLIHGFSLGKDCFLYDADAFGTVVGSAARTHNRMGMVLFRE